MLKHNANLFQSRFLIQVTAEHLSIAVQVYCWASPISYTNTNYALLRTSRCIPPSALRSVSPTPNRCLIFTLKPDLNSHSFPHNHYEKCHHFPFFFFFFLTGIILELELSSLHLGHISNLPFLSAKDFFSKTFLIFHTAKSVIQAQLLQHHFLLTWHMHSILLMNL